MNLRDPGIWEALFAWLHLLAAALAAGLLLTESWLCRRPLDRVQVRLLGTVDLGYFLALIAALATGLALGLVFGRGLDAYTANALVWMKTGLFAVLGLLAVLPMRQFIRWNREARSAPAFAPLSRDLERLQALLRLELGLLALIALAAVLIARGYGLPATAP